MIQVQTQAKAAAPALSHTQRGLLQRKCACGGTRGPSGECAACRRKRQLGGDSERLQPKLRVNQPGDRYEQEADRIASQAMSSSTPSLQRSARSEESKPEKRTLFQFAENQQSDGAAGSAMEAPIEVYDVLRSSGQSLDLATRHEMEGRLGNDFGQVRIHTDVQAAESARMVNAQAYTVGSDIVFGNGYYSPSTNRGKKLLAHELVHVVQQNGNQPRLQRAMVDEPFSSQDGSERQPFSHRSTLPYREATALLECIRIMGESNREYCRQEVLGEGNIGGSFSSGTAPAAAPQPAFVQCNPNRALTWADFTGTPSGTHSAFTAYDYPTATTPAGTRIQAVFSPSRSFVRPQFASPMDPNLNGCAANITQCESFFPPGSTGGSFALNSTPSRTCPASIRANPAVVASKHSDCAGIIATECERVAVAESNRLLAHEQLHFDIACTLVGKANAALVAGATLTSIQTALTAKDTQVTNQYDTQTNHGCNAAQQATWQTNVAGGLTSVTIP